jgi:hypothetical protein
MGSIADHIAAALSAIPGSINDKLIAFFSSLEGGDVGDVLTKTADGFALEAPTGGVGGTSAFHGCFLKISVNQAMGAGLDTIEFDLEDFDTDGYHDPAVNPSRITIPAGLGGIYQVGFQGQTAVDFDNRLLAAIRVNGVDFPVGIRVDMPAGVAANTNFPGGTATRPLALVEGDYIEFFTNLPAGTTFSPETSFWAYLKGTL